MVATIIEREHWTCPPEGSAFGATWFGGRCVHKGFSAHPHKLLPQARRLFPKAELPKDHISIGSGPCESSLRRGSSWPFTHRDTTHFTPDQLLLAPAIAFSLHPIPSISPGLNKVNSVHHRKRRPPSMLACLPLTYAHHPEPRINDERLPPSKLEPRNR